MLTEAYHNYEISLYTWYGQASFNSLFVHSASTERCVYVLTGVPCGSQIDPTALQLVGRRGKKASKKEIYIYSLFLAAPNSGADAAKKIQIRHIPKKKKKNAIMFFLPRDSMQIIRAIKTYIKKKMGKNLFLAKEAMLR